MEANLFGAHYILRLRWEDDEETVVFCDSKAYQEYYERRDLKIAQIIWVGSVDYLDCPQIYQGT